MLGNVSSSDCTKRRQQQQQLKLMNRWKHRSNCNMLYDHGRKQGIDYQDMEQGNELWNRMRVLVWLKIITFSVTAIVNRIQ